MKPNEQALRIDQAVSFWEDQSYHTTVARAMNRTLRLMRQEMLEGPYMHAPEFRRSLLRSVIAPFDTTRFLGLHNETSVVLGAWANVPMMVHAWSKHSRRIYHLTREIQALLNVTSLRRCTWADIAWPFDAFALTVATPIVSTRGASLDCALVFNERQGNNTQRLSLLLLPYSLARYQPLTQSERSQLSKLVRRKNWVQLATLTPRLNARATIIDNPDYFQIRIRDSAAQAVTDTFSTQVAEFQDRAGWRDVPSDQIPLLEMVVRLVIGTCLYVTTKPAGISPTTEWETLATIPGGEPNVIVRQAQTCVVQSAYRLDPTEMHVFEEVGAAPHPRIEMSPHFRCGFWRRPPGEGHNPLAPKTIWVRPTIVRADRLPPGTLPRGSQAKVV